MHNPVDYKYSHADLLLWLTRRWLGYLYKHVHAGDRPTYLYGATAGAKLFNLVDTVVALQDLATWIWIQQSDHSTRWERPETTREGCTLRAGPLSIPGCIYKFKRVSSTPIATLTYSQHSWLWDSSDSLGHLKKFWLNDWLTRLTLYKRVLQWTTYYIYRYIRRRAGCDMWWAWTNQIRQYSMAPRETGSYLSPSTERKTERQKDSARLGYANQTNYGSTCMQVAPTAGFEPVTVETIDIATRPLRLTLWTQSNLADRTLETWRVEITLITNMHHVVLLDVDWLPTGVSKHKSQTEPPCGRKVNTPIHSITFIKAQRLISTSRMRVHGCVSV